jgi:protein-tyrosine phosphatase
VPQVDRTAQAPHGSPEAPTPLHLCPAGTGDVALLVRLRDDAARWQAARGIAQWRPGQLGEDHFRRRLDEGEVWIAALGPDGPVAGAFELWWSDPYWRDLPQPPSAAYVHRLMTDHRTAPPGTGRALLAAAERRIAATGRTLARLDCQAGNARLRAYYRGAGYTAVGETPAREGGPFFPVTLHEKHLADAPAH